MKKNTILTIVASIALLVLSSCAGQTEAQKAQAEALAKYQTRLSAIQTELKTAASPALVEEALDIQSMQINQPEQALALAAQYPEIVTTSVKARIFVALSQCKMAGVAEKTEDKLGWLRKGTRSFDSIHRDYPDNEIVYTYQAITYSYFPSEAGALDETLDLLTTMKAWYQSAKWKLSDEQAGRLWMVYQNLAKYYPDGPKHAKLLEHARLFSTDLPLMAANPAAKEVLHV